MSLQTSGGGQPARERSTEAPPDKPKVERGEHANLERPGAQSHPAARDRQRVQSRAGWQERL